MRRVSELVIWVVFKRYRRACRPLCMLFGDPLQRSQQSVPNKRRESTEVNTHLFGGAFYTQLLPFANFADQHRLVVGIAWK